MNGMHGGHMGGAAPPPSMNGTGMMRGGGGNGMNHHKMMMMHMTFYWGKNAEILFSGWPGFNTGMYVLSLLFVFVMAFLLEWLSHCSLIKEKDDGSNRVGASLFQTLMYSIRVGLSYLVMLALMSFNVGVLLVAVAGHSLGFFLFGSRLFKSASGKNPDLPPPDGVC